MTKKMIRNIIVGVVLLGLLGGLYVFISMWEPTDNSQEEKEPVDIMCVVDAEDVSEIQVKNESGEYTLICKEEADKKVYDITSLDVTDKNMSAISSSFNSFKKIYAMREISSDNGGYGFEESNTSLTLKADTDIEIIFGSKTPGGDEYYCINKKDNKIYTVSDTMYNLVTQPADYYRNKSVIAINDVYLINNMEVYEDGQPKLKLRHATDEENSSKIMAAAWTMEYPWYAELANDKTEELLTKLSTVFATGFSKDSHNYKYKLVIKTEDKTYSVEVAEGDDVSYVKDAENGYVYITDKEIFDTLSSIDPSKYISRFVNLVNIEDIKKATVTANNKEYVMEVQDGKYKINGTETDEKEFKKKYQAVIGISFIEFVDDKPAGNPYMTLEFELKDGTMATTKIYDYTEREYLAICPNGTTVKLLKNELKSIEDIM